jgi:hypothetical protein
MSYIFEFAGNSNNSYLFKTSLGIGYEVKFKPSAYMLGDDKAPYANYIFEFVIDLIYNPLDKNPPLDKLVSDTIAAIMIDFYYRKNESVCIYICESSDGRKSLRKQKFDDWYYSHNKLGLVKIDVTIFDANGEAYPVSAILRLNNPYYIEILVAFAKIAADNTK